MCPVLGVTGPGVNPQPQPGPGGPCLPEGHCTQKGTLLVGLAYHGELPARWLGKGGTSLSHPACPGLPPPRRHVSSAWAVPSPRRALLAGVRDFPRKALIPRAGWEGYPHLTVGPPLHQGVAWPWTVFLGRVWSPFSHWQMCAGGESLAQSSK